LNAKPRGHCLAWQKRMIQRQWPSGQPRILWRERTPMQNKKHGKTYPFEDHVT
jgi:hypothetical protein